MDFNETIRYLGGPTGALAHTGTQHIAYSENALHLYSNGCRDHIMSIVQRPNYTYTVSLIDESKPTVKRLLASRDGVSRWELQAAVEQLYDAAFPSVVGSKKL